MFSMSCRRRLLDIREINVSAFMVDHVVEARRHAGLLFARITIKGKRKNGLPNRAVQC